MKPIIHVSGHVLYEITGKEDNNGDLTKASVDVYGLWHPEKKWFRMIIRHAMQANIRRIIEQDYLEDFKFHGYEWRKMFDFKIDWIARTAYPEQRLLQNIIALDEEFHEDITDDKDLDMFALQFERDIKQRHYDLAQFILNPGKIWLQTHDEHVLTWEDDARHTGIACHVFDSDPYTNSWMAQFWNDFGTYIVKPYLETPYHDPAELDFQADIELEYFEDYPQLVQVRLPSGANAVFCSYGMAWIMFRNLDAAFRISGE